MAKAEAIPVVEVIVLAEDLGNLYFKNHTNILNNPFAFFSFDFLDNTYI